MIKTYIINMAKDVNRKEHMENVLSDYHEIFSAEFIEGIEGRKLSDEEICKVFDTELAYRRYGRNISKGEIGCTLSHYKCYRKLLDTGEDYALVLEDDITILKDLHPIQAFVPVLKSDAPVVLLLSGDYWYKSKEMKEKDLTLVSVFDAVGAYAYMINRAAAKVILEKFSKPSCVADHWSLYREAGILLKAVNPYIIDANIENLESTIGQYYFGEIKKNMDPEFRKLSYYNALMKKVLLISRHFVSKIRK